MFRKLLACGSIGLALVLAGARPALAAHPEKPVRVIVPFAPGGATDVVARTLAARLSQILPISARPDSEVLGTSRFSKLAKAIRPTSVFGLLVESSVPRRRPTAKDCRDRYAVGLDPAASGAAFRCSPTRARPAEPQSWSP